jgi:hypothetical protein
MKLRHLLILGLLVFLNGFVLTVLFLMVSREMARPVATPTQVTTVEPTIQPTFTSTATETPTVLPPPTNTPEPTPTSTLVAPPSTPTPTDTPAPPTSTLAPPTPTFTPAPPSPTSPPSSPTPTSTPAATSTSTPESKWDFVFVEGSVITAPNCGAVYLQGKITGVGGEAVDGKTVRLRWWDNVDFDISGPLGGNAPGAWGFAPLAPEQFKSHQPFVIDIVESEANPVPISNAAHIDFTDCDIAGQFTNITFAYAR